MARSEGASSRASSRVDGRRARGADNRRRIVEAFIALVGRGSVSPTAEEVAERADVGLRTVFRHFDDMEGLYREISAEIEAQMLPIVEQPFASTSWREQLHELVERRAKLFERITPYKISSMVNGHTSSFLRNRQRRFVRLLRSYLVRVLPPALAADIQRIDVLDLLLSFEAWHRMRHEQSLSIADACKVLHRSVDLITDGVMS